MRTAIILIFAAFVCACTRAESGTNPANEKKVLENPVQATTESVATGKRYFDKLCAECHGEKGDGVSEIAATMTADEVRPPDLTDDKWDHGSTDGELFVTIRDGVGGPGAMKRSEWETRHWPDRDMADGELHPEPAEVAQG